MNDTFIIQDLALLVDKAGRLPKSFATRKINLPSPNQVAPFLRSALKLLDTAIAVSSLPHLIVSSSIVSI